MSGVLKFSIYSIILSMSEGLARPCQATALPGEKEREKFLPDCFNQPILDEDLLLSCAYKGPIGVDRVVERRVLMIAA